MSVTLTKVGALAVRNGEAITGIRRKVAGVSCLVGFSDVDASRLAATVSEIGRRLLSAEAGAVIGVYLNGSNPIEGLALSFPENEAVADILRRSHYFDHLAATEEDETKSLLALKRLRGKGAALDDQKLLQIDELLSRPSREELMGELQSTNEELETHQVNLERTVTERTASLIEANEELEVARGKAEDATKTKSSFLAAMSHEIRTPMNGVVGMIELLGETEMKLDQRQMMTTIRDSAHSLLQIINDILDFSKIESGKLELEALPISMRDAVEGVVETLTSIAEKKDVLLTTFVDPALPAWVTGDQVRLRQVLFNLTGNAVKFTDSSEDRRGVVDVSAEMVAMEEEYATVRITVSDTGIGMDQAQIERLFEPFTQAEGSTTRRFGGTGLGLSICKNLTEIMGGAISVRSAPGEGSTFTVDLPLAPNHSRPPPEDEPDLQGVPVLMLAEKPGKHLRFETYLKAWHAKTDWCSEPRECADRLRDLAKRGDEYVVLLICSDIAIETRQALLGDLRGGAGLERLRFVVLSHLQGERFGMINPDKVVIRDRPLRRSALIHGVAVAVGRASPEMPQEVQRIGVEDREVPTVEQARAAGQLILLAEDNLTNQDVIRRQVNRLGYALEIADDGVQALDMARTGKYGLLLTDCHMPNKDGYELTEEIRAAEADGRDRLPIIAITANILKGEFDRCLAAGMDDHLTKPVELRLLKRKLTSWLPRQPSYTQGGGSPVIYTEPADATPAPSDAPIDVNAIKELIGDDDEMAHEVLQDFVAPAGQNVAEILASWQQQDVAGVVANTHKLKSSARAIGARALADLCFDLEQAGKADDAEVITQWIRQLEPLFTKVKTYIEGLS